MNPLTWLHFPFFFLLVYLLWFQARENQDLRKIFWPALLLKLVAGLFLGYLFQKSNNGGDTWFFHSDALRIIETAKQDFNWIFRFLFLDDIGNLYFDRKDFINKELSNSFFFLKILSLLHLLTNSSYWFSSLYLSLFSFWGCWYLVNKIQKYFPVLGLAAAVAFLFFPSVVFWTSGVSKESVFMGSLCLTAGLFLQLSKAKEKSKGVFTLLGLVVSSYLLWKIKFFLAAVLLVLLATWLFIEWLTPKLIWLQTKTAQLLAWGALILTGAFVASFAHPTFNLDFFARHVVWNYQKILAKSDPSKPVLLLPELEASLVSITRHAPEAVFQMLFRPFVWEPAPMLYKLAGLENLLLLLLVGAMVLQVVYKRQWPHLPGFLAVLLVFFFIGAVLVSLPTPNLGSLFRYRAPLLPFFLTVVLAWGPWQVWFNWLIRRLP